MCRVNPDRLFDLWIGTAAVTILLTIILRPLPDPWLLKLGIWGIALLTWGILWGASQL